MKKWLDSPQTLIGAIIAIAGVALVIAGKHDTGTVMIGIGATWIGVTGKDANKA